MLVCLCGYLGMFAFYPSIAPTRSPASVHVFLLLVSGHSLLGLVVLFLIQRYGHYYHGIFAYVLFVLPRVLSFQMLPWLSDDVFRYLWDGSLLASGINPYIHAPAAAELTTFRNNNSDLYALLDYRYITTIYPPLAEYIFTLATSIGRLFTPVWQGAYWSWKALLLVSEGIGVWCVWKALEHLKRSPVWLLAYLCIPLSVVEIAGQAHLDGLLLAPLGILIFLAARQTTLPHRRTNQIAAMGTLVALLGALKILPFVLALPLVRWCQTARERRLFFALFVVMSLMLWLPLFSSSDAIGAFIHTVSATTQSFQFNGGFYYALCYACALVGIEQFWLYTPIFFTYMRLVVVLGMGCIFTVRNPHHLWVALLATFSTAVLISAKVHTWYFLPLLLVNSLVGWKWLYVLALGSMLSYGYYATIPAQEWYGVEMAVWLVSGGVGVSDFTQIQRYKPSAAA